MLPMVCPVHHFQLHVHQLLVCSLKLTVVGVLTPEISSINATKLTNWGFSFPPDCCLINKHEHTTRWNVYSPSFCIHACWWPLPKGKPFLLGVCSVFLDLLQIYLSFESLPCLSEPFSFSFYSLSFLPSPLRNPEPYRVFPAAHHAVGQGLELLLATPGRKQGKKTKFSPGYFFCACSCWEY